MKFDLSMYRKQKRSVKLDVARLFWQFYHVHVWVLLMQGN